MSDKKLMCAKCHKELVMKPVKLDYLKHQATNDFLVCPECGNLYIPEDIVMTKMKKVETDLEDK